MIGIDQLSLNEAVNLLLPLTLFVLGMTIYALFIFKFYRYIAQRDIFKLQLYQKEYYQFVGVKNFFKIIAYLFEYVFLFPVVIFVWFSFLSLLLIILSKEQSVAAILLSSMSLVAVVRICAYYNENLSQDLAKMLPFALLGVFIIDITFFSFTHTMDMLKTVPSVANQVVYYLMFAMGLELIMRILYLIFRPVLPRSDDKNSANS